jgi:hypothetical protein
MAAYVTDGAEAARVLSTATAAKNNTTSKNPSAAPTVRVI